MAMVAVAITAAEVVVVVTVAEGRATTVEGWGIWRGNATRVLVVDVMVDVEGEAGGSAEDMLAAAEDVLIVGKKVT